jgi:hypothetical protein
MVQILYGADGFLLEDELNEAQWTQINSLADTNRKQFTNGFLDNFTINTNATANTFKISNSAGTTEPFNFLIDGYNLTAGQNAGTSNQGELILTLNAPPSSGTRTDLIILEAWFEAMNYTETIKKYGGTDTPAINPLTVDSRVNKETSRRIQFRWRLRTLDNATVGSLVNAKASLYNGTLSAINYALQGDIYVAATGQQTTGTGNSTAVKTDGTVYAIPLFTVSRSAGVTSIAVANVTDVSPKSRIKDGQVRTEIINSIYNKVNTELIDTKVKNTLLIGENISLTDANNNFQSTTVASGLDEIEVAANNAVSALNTELKEESPSGLLNVGIITTNFSGPNQGEIHAPGYGGITGDTVRSINGIRFGDIDAVINGNLVNIYNFGSRNDTEPDFSTVMVPTPPTSGTRDDLVFIEAFWTLKNPGDPIYAYNGIGNKVVRNATTYENVFEWRFRTAAGVDFSKYPEGLGISPGYTSTTAVLPQGNNSNSIDALQMAQANDWSFWFRKSGVKNGDGTVILSPSSTWIDLKDNGVYVAGHGSQVAKDTLKTYDGYVYAIPLLRIKRRNSAGYRPDNLNGAREYYRVQPTAGVTLTNAYGAVVNVTDTSKIKIGDTVRWLLVGGITVFKTNIKITAINGTAVALDWSDSGPITGNILTTDFFDFTDGPGHRPDGLHANAIDKTDIVDLRHKISLTDFNYQQMLEDNFDKLLRGELQTKDKTITTKEYLNLNPAPINMEANLMPVKIKGDDGVDRNLVNILGPDFTQKENSFIYYNSAVTSIVTDTDAPVSKKTLKFQRSSAAVVNAYIHTDGIVPIVNGENYLFTGWVKTDVAGYVQTSIRMNDANWTSIAAKKFYLNAGVWTYFEFKFTSTITAKIKIIVDNYQTGTSAITWLNGYSMFKIDQATYDKIDVDPAFTGTALLPKFPYVTNYLTVSENLISDFNSRWSLNGGTIDKSDPYKITNMTGTQTGTYTLAAIPNQKYVLTVDEFVPGATGDIHVDWLDSSGAYIAGTSTFTSGNIWTFTTPSNAATLKVYVRYVTTVRNLKLEKVNVSNVVSTMLCGKFVPYGRWILPYDYANGDTSLRTDQFFNRGRLTISNAQVSDTITEIIEPLKTPQRHITAMQATPGQWAVNDTIKINSYDGVVTGVIDSDTALATVVADANNVVNTVTLYLNDVSKFAVNDTFNVLHASGVMSSISYTVTAVDTVNKTITASFIGTTTINIGAMLFETTTSTSSPVATAAGLAGTWSGLGSKTATFTITTAPTNVSDNIKIQYSISYSAGKGLNQIASETLGATVNGAKMIKASDNIVRIKTDFNGKIASNTDLNPNILRYGFISTLGNMSTLVGVTENVNTSQINAMWAIDGNPNTQNTTTNGTIPQGIFSFDIIRTISDKLGEGVFADCLTLADKVAKAKSIVTKITSNWWGYGSNIYNGTLTYTTDFAGKVSASTVENPNIFYQVVATTVLYPSSVTSGGGTELSDARYGEINTLNGTSRQWGTAAVQGHIAQHVVAFDLGEYVKRKYNLSFKPDQAWLRANVYNVNFKWYGYGSGPSGNYATVKIWNGNGPSWTANGTTNFNSASSPSLVSVSRFMDIPDHNLAGGIDSNGMIYFVAYAEASDGVTTSIINTDYVSLDVTLIGGGYKAYTSVWYPAGSSWYNQSSYNHTNSTTTKTSIGVGSVSSYIDSNGFIHFNAYADPSNGLSTSLISTDYIDIELELDMTESGYDVLTPVNKYPIINENILSQKHSAPRDPASYTTISQNAVTGIEVKAGRTGIKYQPVNLAADNYFLMDLKGRPKKNIPYSYSFWAYADQDVTLRTGSIYLQTMGESDSTFKTWAALSSFSDGKIKAGTWTQFYGTGIVPSTSNSTGFRFVLRGDWDSTNNLYTSTPVWFTDIVVKENPTADVWAPGRICSTTQNFVGKVSGSTFENPHRYIWRSSNDITVAPSVAWPNNVERLQSEYDLISKQDGSMCRSWADTTGQYSMQLFEFDLSNLGLSLTELKSAIRRLTIRWIGYGAGDNAGAKGYGATMRIWEDNVRWGGGDSAWQNAASTPSSISNYFISSGSYPATRYIDSNQKVYISVYSTYTASAANMAELFTDYIALDVELAEYVDYTPSPPVKVRKETKEIKLVYPAKSNRYGNAGYVELFYRYLPIQDFFNGTTITGNILAVRDKALFTTDYDVEGINKYNKKLSYTNYMNRIPISSTALGRMKKGAAIAPDGIVPIFCEPNIDSLGVFNTEAPFAIASGDNFGKFLSSTIYISADGRINGSTGYLKFNTFNNFNIGILYFIPVLAEVNGELYLFVIANTMYYNGTDNTYFDSRGSLYKLDGRPIIKGVN